jgi:hypothetical protein
MWHSRPGCVSCHPRRNTAGAAVPNCAAGAEHRHDLRGRSVRQAPSRIRDDWGGVLYVRRSKLMDVTLSASSSFSISPCRMVRLLKQRRRPNRRAENVRVVARRRASFHCSGGTPYHSPRKQQGGDGGRQRARTFSAGKPDAVWRQLVRSSHAFSPDFEKFMNDAMPLAIAPIRKIRSTC